MIFAPHPFRAALQHAAIALISVLALSSLTGGARASTAEPGPSAEEVARLIEEWRFGEAEAAEKALLAAHPDDPIALLLDGNLRFNLGDYEGAAERLKILDRAGGEHREWRSLADLVAGTRDATAGFVEARSAEGHFIIRHAPGKDELLLPYAFAALEGARREIAEHDFDAGALLADPVRVEIYPEIADLAKVSTLTMREIETSGTIAICKFNRLMITSPRALAHGYPWLDTLAHEYTHYVLTRVSRNNAPIWFHEGVAKFEERRWRQPLPEASATEKPGADAGLSPTMEHLLATALSGNGEHKSGHGRRLITFDEMYPSMAKLPSQEDSALAFAEVYTVLEYLHQKKGWAGIRQVIERMRDGKGDAGAVAEVLGQGFEEFQRSWKGWLRGRKLRAHPGLVPAALKFTKGKKSQVRARDDREEKDEADAGDVAEERARRFVRLGGMLRAQGRMAPAAMEYEKAQAVIGPGHVVVANRLAHTYLALGDLDRAIAAAQPAFDLYPDSAAAAATLGEAYFKKKDGDRAAPYLEATIRVSPFDPMPHCNLAEIYRQRGPAGAAQADIEARACKGLSGERE